MIKLDQATFCFKGTSFRWLEVKSNFFRAEKNEFKYWKGFGQKQHLANWLLLRGSRMRSDFCWRLPQPSTPFLHPAKSQISAGDIQFIAYKHVLITCSSPSPDKELPVTSSTASLAQHCNLEAGSNSPASLFNDRFKVSKLARGDMSGSVASWFKETSSSFKLFKVSRGGKLVNCTKHSILKATQYLWKTLLCHLISFQH